MYLLDTNICIYAMKNTYSFPILCLKAGLFKSGIFLNQLLLIQHIT